MLPDNAHHNYVRLEKIMILGAHILNPVIVQYA